MAELGPELQASSVQEIEFFLPGQGLRREVLRYVRQPDGTFRLLAAPVPAP